MYKYRIIIALMLSLIFIGCPVPAEQHVLRDNKVWSLKLKVKYCGFVAIAARSAIWEYNKGSRKLSPINTDYSIYQWSWTKDPEIELKHYRPIDIIAEMAADRIYLLQLLVREVGTGTATKEDVFIPLNYWISPLGLNTIPITPVPLRQFIDGDFDADDQKLFNNWLVANHKYGSNRIWRDVNRLRHKLDGESTVNINIGNGTCIDM